MCIIKHYRLNDSAGNAQPWGGATVAVIHLSTFQAIGVSICSVKDIFDPVLGATRALGRALKQCDGGMEGWPRSQWCLSAEASAALATWRRLQELKATYHGNATWIDDVAGVVKEDFYQRVRRTPESFPDAEVDRKITFSGRWEDDVYETVAAAGATLAVLQGILAEQHRPTHIETIRLRVSGPPIPLWGARASREAPPVLFGANGQIESFQWCTRSAPSP